MYQYKFGVVTNVCRKDGIMDLMEFKDGELIATGKVSFLLKNGQFFTPGRRQPQLSGSRTRCSRKLVGMGFELGADRHDRPEPTRI